MKKAPEWQTPEQQAEFYHHQKYIEEIKTQRREIISDELLPVYSASAEKCGLHINIIGRPGDVYTPQNPSTFNLREHTVQSGKLHIAITAIDGREMSQNQIEKFRNEVDRRTRRTDSN